MKIPRKVAKECGIEVPKGRARKAEVVVNAQATADQFKLLCRAHGLPEPEPEFEFHRDRKWRFDWIFDRWVALEVLGGTWTGGHHSRGKDQQDDWEKWNEATVMGFSVLFVSPQDVTSGKACELVKRALFGENGP